MENKTYTIYESKIALVKVASGITLRELSIFGEIKNEIFGDFSSMDLADGRPVGFKLHLGIKRFYAFEEKSKNA